MRLIQSVKKRMGSTDKPLTKTTLGKSEGGHTASSPPSAFTMARSSVHSPGKNNAVGISASGGGAAQAASSSGGTRAIRGASSDENTFENLPLLKDAAMGDRVDLFRKKLRACCKIYDFRVPTYEKEKEAKRQTLLELVEHITSSRTTYTDQLMLDVVSMVGANIFRALPTTSQVPAIAVDPDEEEPNLDPAWPHLQVVYEFFLRFIISNEVDPKAAKKYIDQNFVVKFLDLFVTEDPRERDFLKTTLHRIYGKFMALRSFIRRAIQNVFHKFVYEAEMRNGIAELLEILGSIINGFALPLKEEHRHFLEYSLIPLHKARSLVTFHQQLTYCMTQFVEKDPRLAEVVILGFLKYWPATNTPKEVLYLNELEELLELCQPPDFQKVMEPVFKRVAQCIESPHFQVAERVLFLWNNDNIVRLINSNGAVIFPLVIGSLYENSKNHWNNTVHGLTYNVLKLLMEANPQLFDESSSKCREEDEASKQGEIDRSAKWKEVAQHYEQRVGTPAPVPHVPAVVGS